MNDWDNKAKMQGKYIKSLIFKARLYEVYSKLLDYQKQLFSESKMVSANSIKARFLGEDENHKTLRYIIEYHNQNMIDVLNFGTMKNY